MKKYFGILLLGVFLINSCEKDDFCTTTPVTPNLVIRFYDKDDITTKKSVSRLSVIAQSKTDSLMTDQTLDSIAIPLNGEASETIYIFKMNDQDGKLHSNKTATLTINYSAQEDYVSRSCGYRYIFKNVAISIDPSNNDWISSISNNSISEISNQIQSHVQIFH